LTSNNQISQFSVSTNSVHFTSLVLSFVRTDGRIRHETAIFRP